MAGVSVRTVRVARLGRSPISLPTALVPMELERVLLGEHARIVHGRRLADDPIVSARELLEEGKNPQLPPYVLRS